MAGMRVRQGDTWEIGSVTGVANTLRYTHRGLPPDRGARVGHRAPEDTLTGTVQPAGIEPEIRYVVPGRTAKQGLVAAGLGITLRPGLAGVPRAGIRSKPVPRRHPAWAVYTVSKPTAVQEFPAILKTT